MSFSILIVDDELEICLSLSEIIRSRGYQVYHCQDPLKVAVLIERYKTDLIILDVKMPGLSGIDLLKKIKKEQNPIPIIIISGHADVDTVVITMKYGALNFYTKPIDNAKLLAEIERVANSKSHIAYDEFSSKIVHSSSKMDKVMGFVEKAAPTNAAVLITGESGTGKELIAGALHNLSPRQSEAFIKINCAAIPENLLESEMFGHEQGAFTDAKNLKKGKFELADNGSIFLDEIGDMSLKTQAKMLRVLQEKRFSRIGGIREIITNCRIIAATNKNLATLIKKSHFREDLYYRLSVITIEIPPLRERKEEILPLVEYFLAYFCRHYAKTIKTMADEVKSLILKHDWPGNVRELRNFIERAVIFTEQDTINLSSLPEQYSRLLHEDNTSFDTRYDNLARDIIIEALEKTKYVKQKAAKLLNIDRKTLYNKMKKYNIR